MKKIIFLLMLSIPVFFCCICFGDITKKELYPKPKNWNPEDYTKTLERTHKKYAYVKEVYKEDLIVREQRLKEMGLGIKDMPYTFIILQSPFVNTYKDIYGPVKFMHGAHANRVNGNCAVCHHYKPKNSSKETVPCRACHQKAFDPDHPQRLGLKAAYHQRCIGCHKELKEGPVNCNGCHRKIVPDHKNLVKLPKNPSPYEVTKECLRCHESAGNQMLVSAHWLWKGPSPFTVNHRKCIKHGKGTDVLNNY